QKSEIENQKCGWPTLSPVVCGGWGSRRQNSRREQHSWGPRAGRSRNLVSLFIRLLVGFCTAAERLSRVRKCARIPLLFALDALSPGSDTSCARTRLRRDGRSQPRGSLILLVDVCASRQVSLSLGAGSCRRRHSGR